MSNKRSSVSLLTLTAALLWTAGLVLRFSVWDINIGTPLDPYAVYNFFWWCFPFAKDDPLQAVNILFYIGAPMAAAALALTAAQKRLWLMVIPLAADAVAGIIFYDPMWSSLIGNIGGLLLIVPLLLFANGKLKSGVLPAVLFFVMAAFSAVMCVDMFFITGDGPTYAMCDIDLRLAIRYATWFVGFGLFTLSASKSDAR